MTTTELIKILQDNEKGAISHKSREISLVINGRYMINPQIKVSGTGDGICGAEIDLDINGEWLEQEPCEDAISRQAVLDLVVANHTELNGLNVVMYSPYYKDIKQLPPVQPIRPKGKWEEWIDRNDYNDFESISYVCNKCHHIEYAATNFCSNCGADMKGES